MTAIANRINAIDVINDAVVCLNGLASALSLKASVEGDSLAHTAVYVLDAKIDALRSVAAWLEVDKPADGVGR